MNSMGKLAVVLLTILWLVVSTVLFVGFWVWVLVGF
jgi:hypothetical protein